MTANPDYWSHSMSTVIKPIFEAFQAVGTDVTLDECTHAVGVAEVNNYVIHDPDKRTGKVLFSSLLSLFKYLDIAVWLRTDLRFKSCCPRKGNETFVSMTLEFHLFSRGHLQFRFANLIFILD